MKKERERLKIVVLNPEEIPAAKRRFTKLVCDLNRDKILKCIEDLKNGELKDAK
ncbi:hypothetical protein [Clostridium coskatii]|uniref:Uncharacterized protein n=1 Tax=Clostridium coskatii TaxID=1705578 RepID=A0A166TUC3_9CLOT|nr:hypothetical protein [Clostridium coskatii]OAA94108.1 hypothetical protein WX73_03678 [Clostridium coskatii]OBR96670.1 hypothetical protein CLCOS_08320 [Clostridium coskatii]